ncbi:helix-turn-helix domain-containing protein [Streptomyces aurantiacus]|uniref:Putative transcriptional activator FeaR n=1 Tax=Streptomyces aurantiacus JA 4570 TaxID=1286094 RepID=S4AS07_9ACTN|nr:helix-turn-helix domain-containing protein [Streptomyces aurantiacus]EPH44212.1 putative transcriptional activator FeaR [Streptomyces aurantiacus JA 4570]
MFSRLLIKLEQPREGEEGFALARGGQFTLMPVTVTAHSRRCLLRRRIDAFIQGHLADPTLSPTSIAEAHHISVRYLYQVFDTHDMAVAAWIRYCRLERCRRDLADLRLRSRPIGAIASMWGFSDAAHFSRAFRAAYGMSPREYRRRRLVQG